MSVYLWLSAARVDIICSRNVIFFPIIYTTIPPVTNDFFTKYMYYDEIKLINVSFSSLLTNLCEKIDFDSWPPEGPFSPDGSHINITLIEIIGVAFIFRVSKLSRIYTKNKVIANKKCFTVSQSSSSVCLHICVQSHIPYGIKYCWLWLIKTTNKKKLTNQTLCNVI